MCLKNTRVMQMNDKGICIKSPFVQSYSIVHIRAATRIVIQSEIKWQFYEKSAVRKCPYGILTE